MLSYASQTNPHSVFAAHKHMLVLGGLDIQLIMMTCQLPIVAASYNDFSVHVQLQMYAHEVWESPGHHSYHKCAPKRTKHGLHNAGCCSIKLHRDLVESGGGINSPHHLLSNGKIYLPAVLPSNFFLLVLV